MKTALEVLMPFGFVYEYPGYFSLQTKNDVDYTIAVSGESCKINVPTDFKFTVQVMQFGKLVYDVEVHGVETALKECIAFQFATILKQWLLPSEVELMKKRNQIEKRENVCHSHDFCDANVAMEEAMEVFRTSSEKDESNLWNDSWKIATQKFFS